MMFGGIEVQVVEPGTEIKHDGETLTVTDDEALIRGSTVYVTQKQYEAIKKANRPSRA